MIVFITGSESTGKTELAKGLAKHFKVKWIPEYAREYISKLNKPYTILDIENIARQQIIQIESVKGSELVFIDTDLINTKVWFEKRFGRVPEWFQKSFDKYTSGFYVICSPDLPWEYDPLRENPHIREELDKMYEEEILRLGNPLFRVSGTGPARIKRAINQIDTWINEQ